MAPHTAVSIAAIRILFLIGCTLLFSFISARQRRLGPAVRGPWLAAVVLGLVAGPLLSIASPTDYLRVFDPARTLLESAEQIQLDAEQEVEQLAQIGVSTVAVTEHRRELLRTRVLPAQFAAQQATLTTQRLELAAVSLPAGAILFMVAAAATARRCRSTPAGIAALVLLLVSLIGFAEIGPSNAGQPNGLLAWLLVSLAIFAMGWLAGLITKPNGRNRQRTLLLASRYLTPCVLVLLSSRAEVDWWLLVGLVPALVLSTPMITNRLHHPAIIVGMSTIAAIAMALLGCRETSPSIAQALIGATIAFGLSPTINRLRARSLANDRITPP